SPPAPLLRGSSRTATAALRDPGERSAPRLARLGVPPREPAPRGLPARWRAPRDRLRAPQLAPRDIAEPAATRIAACIKAPREPVLLGQGSPAGLRGRLRRGRRRPPPAPKPPRAAPPPAEGPVGRFDAPAPREP